MPSQPWLLHQSQRDREPSVDFAQRQKQQRFHRISVYFHLTLQTSLFYENMYTCVCVCVGGGGGGGVSAWVSEWVRDRKTELLQSACATEALFRKSDRTISPDARKAHLFVLATLTFLSWPVLATLVSRFRTAINTSLYKQAHFKCLLLWLRWKSNESALYIHQYPTAEAIKFIFLKLCYCNYLLSGWPLYILNRVQEVHPEVTLCRW